MSRKKSSLVITDIIDELTEENKRLLNELFFANQCIKTLTEFKSCVDLIAQKFKPILDLNELQNYEELCEKVRQICDRNAVDFYVKLNDNICDDLSANYNNLLIESFDCKSEELVINANQYSNKRRKQKAIRVEDRKRLKTWKRQKSLKIGLDDILDTNHSSDTKLLGKRRKKCLNKKSNLVKYRRDTKSNEMTIDIKVEDQSVSEESNGLSDKSEDNLQMNDSEHEDKPPKSLSKYKTRIFLCDFCGEKLEKYPRLVEHYRRVHPNEEFVPKYKKHQYICDIGDCGLEFVSEETFNDHMLSEHSIERPYPCDHPGCDYRSKTRTVLRSHKMTHNKNRPFVCTHDGCLRSFGAQCHLSQHIRHFHSGKDFICTHEGCDKSFGAKFTLNHHIETVHSLVKKYRCEWPGCEFSSSHKCVITEHIKVHTKERNFGCDVDGCGKRFSTQRQCRDHKNRVHRLGQQLSCHWPGCDFRTYCDKSLRRHESNHRTGGNYPCVWPECDKKYATKGSLVEHINTIHKNYKPLVCSVFGCSYRTAVSSNFSKHMKKHKK